MSTVPTCTCGEIDGDLYVDNGCPIHGLFDTDDFEDADAYRDLIVDGQMGVGW